MFTLEIYDTGQDAYKHPLTMFYLKSEADSTKKHLSSRVHMLISLQVPFSI